MPSDPVVPAPPLPSARAAPSPSSPPALVSDLRERYLRAVLAGDRREAVRLVLEDGLDRGVPTADLHHGVIAAAQQEIGRLWQLNLVTVAREHMASAITHLVLAALFGRAVALPSVGKRVIVACVEGEMHDLPARIVADTLELAGFDVAFLGANVPLDDMVAHARTDPADLICLSVTMTFHIPALRAAITSLRAVTSTALMIGGHAVGWSAALGEELGVMVSGSVPELIVMQARLATGLPPVRPPA